MSTGACLRQEVEAQSALGQEAQRYLDKNQYVPDSLALSLVSSWLEEHPEGWLLDGFPRSVPQVRALNERVKASFLALHLEVPVDELRRRVVRRRECSSCSTVATEDITICPNCGELLKVRDDDSLEGFEKRLQAYQELTIPAVSFLQERGQLVTIEGSGSREEVAKLIRERLISVSYTHLTLPILLV